MKASARLLVGLSFALGALVGPAGVPGMGASDAGAWTDGACTDSSGVTVVVDFQDLGGGVSVRCAPGRVTSGFDALDKAGISYQTTIRFPGFLCKIAGKPTNDPCQTTSPASAYWSYWIASRGGQWCYSNLGAGNRPPPAGSVEGWSFSLGKDGSTSPPPRSAVPAAIPGSPSTPLPSGECDPRPGSPKPIEPPPANTSPPKPNPPAGASPGSPGPGVREGNQSMQFPPAPRVGQAGGSDPAFPPVEGQNGQPADTTGTVDPDGASVGDVSAVDTAGEASIPAEPAPSTETTDKVESGDRTKTSKMKPKNAEAAGVDLSSDGARSNSSPVGVILALVMVALIGSGAFVVRRRGNQN